MNHTRTLKGALAAICCASLLAGCADARRSPTEPGRVAESLTVSGARTVSEGETVTLLVTVLWSTGAIETVTDGVTWVVDDPRIASIDQRGVVTALAHGESRIRAMVNSVSGTTTLRVLAGMRTFSGVVHESWPTDEKSIAEAMVTAVDVAGNTQYATTDGSGRFTLRLASGIAVVTTAAAGYETAMTSVDLTGAELSLSLAPVRRELRESFVYESSSRFPAPRPSEFIDQRIYRLFVHHSGELRAQYTGSIAGASSQRDTCLEVRGANNRILDHSRGDYDIPARPMRLDVTPGIYEVKFFSCNPYGPAFTASLTKFSGEVKYPS